MFRSFISNFKLGKINAIKELMISTLTWAGILFVVFCLLSLVASCLLLPFVLLDILG